MRPVIKWNIGQNGVVAEYIPWNAAKKHLLKNFGNEPFYYCSYCDRYIAGVNLEVEHIKPKGLPQYDAIKYHWNNFLISCKNCNLAKNDQDFEYSDVIMPHIQNTFGCFAFNNDGTVTSIVDDDVTRVRALNTIKILGLDRGYNHPSRQPQDDRYNVRRYILELASRKLIQYEADCQDVEDIVQLSITHGFWSIWMKVFERHTVVQDALITAYAGTFDNCRTTNIDRL